MSDKDRGLEPPKDYPDPLDPPEPFDPDPFEGIRNSLAIRVYLVLIVIVIAATAVFWE